MYPNKKLHCRELLVPLATHDSVLVLLVLEDASVSEYDSPYDHLDLVLWPGPQQDALGPATSLGPQVSGFGRRAE